MVDGISGVNTGSIKDLPVYQQYYNEYLAHLRKYKSDISFEAYLTLEGKKEFFLQKVENYLEGGGDSIQGNTISGSRYINNGNFSIYQSQDEDTYYEFDFNEGSYRVLHGKEEAAAALGIDGENIDTLTFGRRSAQATDYTFGNLEDGQDSSTSNVSGGLYGGVTYKKQEFDLDYIFNALLMNPNDPQYQIASDIFDDLVDNMKQWCPASDLAALDEIAAQYGTNSVQYKTKLKEVLLANLDQANEWIDGHSHVEFKQDTSFDPVSEADKAKADAAAAEAEKNKVPEYDRRSVIENSGYYADYQFNTMKKGGWKKGDSRSEDAHRSALEQMEPIINALINSLKAQLGDQWTSEMDNIALKVKRELLDGYFQTTDESICNDEKIKKSDVWATTDCKTRWGHRQYEAIVSVKNLTDAFFTKFDAICKNGGKTDAEVAAEKKAAEEKAAKEKAGYQTLYNMNMKSVGSEAGVRDVTVVPTSNNQYAEIQEKAQNDIIKPLKNKIKEKLKNSNIPESELDRILTYAEETALANPSNWASTSNNYTYTISSSKLIELFQDAVKSAVKSKGYDF